MIAFISSRSKYTVQSIITNSLDACYLRQHVPVVMCWPETIVSVQESGMSRLAKQLHPMMCHKTQTLCTAASSRSIVKKEAWAYRTGKVFCKGVGGI